MRSARSVARRRSAISAKITRSSSTWFSIVRRQGPYFCSLGKPQPRKISGGMLTVLFTSGRSSASRASSVTPKTTCRMTSRVSAFIRSSDSNGSPSRQRPHLGLGQPGDHVLVAAQRVAVERRHQQLAGALVLAGVDEQQRVLAHHRAEDRVALAGVEDLGVAREDLLDVLGPVEDHEVVGPRAGS